MSRMLATVVAALSFHVAFANVAQWDPRMATENAVVDTNGVKWIDGRFMPIEGRAFDNVDHYYDRLPSTVTTNVNGGVRSMKHHTSGLQFRFSTDSKKLRLRWKPYSPSVFVGDNLNGIAASGFDIYHRKPGNEWRYLSSARISDTNGSMKVYSWIPGEECLINFPLYNGVREVAVGIDAKASVKPLSPRASGVTKPVVFYGTSITHGGCASRPGLAFVNIVGRDLDVPVVNLGFSGCGIMEFEMSEHLAKIDASCYVLDCLWNMYMSGESSHRERNVDSNYEPFIRNLRAKRPDVPIVMAEQCDVFCGSPNAKDRYIRKLYEKLVAEGWKNLVYLPKTNMYSGDGEGTVDDCHPNDLGMETMAKAFGAAVREALKLD